MSIMEKNGVLEFPALKHVDPEVLLIQENKSISDFIGHVFRVFQDLSETRVMLYYTDEID
jgi:ABC-type histidine transport system ATPase subunit